MNGEATTHTTPLGTTGWRVWRWALLRAAGFPASGPDRFAAGDAARAADACLRSGGDDGGRDAFDKAFDAATASASEAAFALAGDPRFREAVTWQNPVAVDTMLDPLRARGANGARNASRRLKETGIARYWSRYCLKNDTIGFFGPICWTRVGEPGPRAGDDPGLPAGVSATPGPSLVKRRTVGIERWALVAYCDRLAADSRMRAWLPAMLTATVCLDGRSLRHPIRGEIALSKAEAAVAARCDGRRAADLAAEVVADPEFGIRTAEDAYLCLGRLADRELVTWGIDVPMTMDDEAVVRHAIAGIGDAGLRAEAEAGWAELTCGRDAVAAAAGDAVALKSALADLAGTFTRVTGRAAQQADGQMYAGRTVCFEDTVRDLTVTFDQSILDLVAEPLSLLCQTARWLSAQVASAYQRELRAIYDELAAESGSPDVPFSELVFLAQGLFFGDGRKPVDEVSDEFIRRWSRLLRLDAGAREVRLNSADLVDAVRREFDAEAPGWTFARYHTPDIHVVTGDDGQPSFVLGELHAAWNAIDSEFFIRAHDESESLFAAQVADIPPGRILPLYPSNWPRLTPRTCAGLRHPDDWQLGFVPAPGADPRRLLPAAALVVRALDGEPDLQVEARDGRRWPLSEVFAELCATHTVDAFKLLGASGHSPRVWIDRMAVARETWRFTAAELDFTAPRDERERYLKVRAWRLEHGLPERVFVKIATEVKPIYVDLTSPTFVSVLCTAIRSGRRDGGDQTSVTVSEMLPAPEQAWVPDAAGDRYTSELRMLIVDPARAAWHEAVR